MSKYLLSDERCQQIDRRQTFAAIAKQEGVSVGCVWWAFQRSSKNRGRMKPRARHAITIRIEAAKTGEAK